MITFDGWETELYHHGIKGQAWGVRRYQHEDGTYTEEGKERYFGPLKAKVSVMTKKAIDEASRKREAFNKIREKEAEELKAKNEEKTAENKKAEEKTKKTSQASSSNSKKKSGKKSKKKKDSDKAKKGKTACKSIKEKGGFDGSIHNRHVKKASSSGKNRWQKMSEIRESSMKTPMSNINGSSR